MRQAAFHHLRRLPLLCALVLLAAAPAFAKGGKPAPKGRPPEWTGDANRPLLQVFDPDLKAYGHVPTGMEEGKKTSLVVVLHGHGGTATGMLGYGAGIGDARSECWLAIEGGEKIDADGKEGHAWDVSMVPGILECVDAAIAKFPVDPKRVVLMGFSAGGTMSLATYAARPSAFAGVYTVSSPAEPSSAQKGARVVVSLGTKDPNYGGFPAARQAAEKTVVGRIVAMEGLVHNDLPDADYTKDHIAWLLDAKAPSETLRLPAKPADDATAPPPEGPAPAKKGGKFRHVLVYEAGGRGAPADAVAKPAAKAAAVAVQAEAKKLGEGGDFGDLVAAKSQDPLSKELRGVVSGAVLSRYGGPLAAAMAKMKGGDMAVVESDAGWHLVYRDP